MRVSIIYTVLLFAAAGVLAAHTSVGQTPENRMTKIGMKNESLKELFAKLRKQTGLSFVFPRKAGEYKNINLPNADRTVKEVLDIVLKETDLNYRFNGNQVFIYEGVRAEENDAVNENSIGLNPSSSLFVVSGSVTDATEAPIVGANIIVKGTTKGTSTDANGEFAIEADENDILVFSFIGFITREIIVGQQTKINVSLQADITTLREVTINGGYYQTNDKLKTGSIVKVTANDIEKQPVTNPLMALQGRVPGLEITPITGAPGVAPKIRIRGTNSLRQQGVVGGDDGNYPLYVIDGVPVNSTPLNSFTNSYTHQGYDPLSTINPSNIESIEILKDGDATAMYGSRGANGVILITTKRNTKSSEHASIDASTYYGIGQISKQLDVLNLKQYLSMRREALAHAGETPEEAGAADLYLWDTTRYTNWQRILLGGNAKITDIQAGISSGTRNTSFRFNGGYHKESLIFPGDFGYYRLSGQLSINHTSENQKFRMSLSTTYGLDNSHYFMGDMMLAALTLPPNAPKLYDEDGALNWELHDVNGLKAANTWINPLSYFKSTQDATTYNNVSNINLSYDVFTGLTLSVNAGFTNVSNNEVSRVPRSASSPSDNPISGTATFVDNERSSWIVEPKASYVKQVEKHKVDVVAGGTWQASKTGLQIVAGDKYPSDALLGSLKGAGVVNVRTDEVAEYRYNSMYARLGYNWDQKYIVSLTGRRDGSSRFGPGNRFGNFGSVGVAWIFSDEKLIQRAIPFVNLGKLRASYGTTGSDNIGDYNYYNLYGIADGKYGGLTGVTPYALYNADYAWEVTKKLEAALELSFAQNKVNLEINWYRNRSSNQLVNYPLSDVTGFQSVQANFDATVENSGWEGVLQFDLLNSNAWRWNTSVNVSLPRNKLVRFAGIEESPYANYYKVGEPLSVKWLYTWTGVNQKTGIHEFVDENDDGLFNNLDRTVQNLNGKIYYGGINNTIQYKNLEISLLFQFSHKQATRFLPGLPGRSINQTTEVLGRWRESGDITDVQRFSLTRESGKTAEASSRYNLLSSSSYNTTDASFIRLKTLSLGYRLSNQWLEKTKIKAAKIFIQGQNLLTITRYEGLDPETGSALPPLRMITGGFQFKF